MFCSCVILHFIGRMQLGQLVLGENVSAGVLIWAVVCGRQQGIVGDPMVR